MSQLFNIQKVIFEEIKTKLPENVSFVHEIAELLGLSYDSAYRRIRCEKILSIEELYKLSTNFGISVDSLFKIKSGKIVFDSLAIDPNTVNIKEWLMGMLRNLQYVQAAKEKKIIYAAKDAPFFHYFQVPELAAFKLFFWEKTLFSKACHFEQKFTFDKMDKEIEDIGRKILLNYIKIPTIEIWNEDTFNIILRQIEYYWVSGLFEKKEDFWLLLDKLETWIKHIQRQAEYGYQFILGQEPHGVEGNYCLYENEVVLSDNTVFVETDSIKTSFLTYNVVNLLTTTNQTFCNRIEHFLGGLIKNSVQISSSAAKERQRFFNRLVKQIESCKIRNESLEV